MATAAEIAERKAQQEAEATARRAGLGGAVQSDEIAPDPTEDRDPSEIDASAPQRTAEPKLEDAVPKPPERPRTLADQKREDLVSRIRARRGADEDSDPFAPAIGTTEQTEPAGADEDAAAEAAAAKAAHEAARKAAETTPAPAARRYKVKVLGEERELSEEEVLAEAQKSLAGDRYLDMAKDRLRQVDDLLSQTRTRATSGPDGTNRAAQTDGTERPGEDEDPDNREDPYVKFVEETQFGEPAQAAARLKDLVREEAKRYAASSTVEQLGVTRAQADIAANKKALEALTKANSDLAEDPDAVAAIRDRMHAGMVQDFVNTGVPTEKIPTRSEDIANWHQWYRLNHPDRVRPFEEVAASAFTGYRQKHAKPAPAETAETAAEGTKEQPAVKRAPQIEVVVERTARRAAIPQQPSRTAIPKPEPQQPQANGQDRSATIQRMNAERMAKRMGRAVPVQ